MQLRLIYCLAGGLAFLVSSPQARAQAAPAVPAPATTPVLYRQQGDVLDIGAWPGPGLDELRALPTCTLDDPPQVVGREILCRPPVVPSKSQLSVAASWLVGLGIDSPDRDNALRGAHGAAIDIDVWPTRWLGIGARAQYLAIKAVPDAAGNAPWGDAFTGFGQARARFFLDEVERDAITLTAGIGYSVRNAEMGPSAPVARVAVSRDIGSYFDDRTAMTLAVELGYEHSLDAEQRRAVTFGLRGGFERGIVEPRNLGTRAGAPWFRYVAGGEFRASSDLGGAGTLGFPLSESLMWRNTALFTFGHSGGLRGNTGATWGVVAGPRWRPSNGDFSVYVDVQAGAGLIGGATTAGVAPLGEAEFGLDLAVGCQTRVNFGGRAQVELDQGLRTGFFIIRVERGPGYARDCGKSIAIAN
ncbi:MAG TPA: hypothetical protein PLF40_16375 [Kofleriaceae bacterium]|nr:hypothetical protein [Kofleriaceae bacterium]